MSRKLGLALTLLILGIVQANAAERDWTSSDGRVMRAEFVRELDGEVTFLKGGKVVTLPLNKLSERDQQIVRDLAAGKPLPQEQSAAPAENEPPIPESSPPTGDSPESSPAKTTREPLIRRPIPIETRTWTDTDGKQTVGRFVRIFGSDVVLLRGGRPITLNYFKLGSEDKDYLRELLDSRGQEDLIPTQKPAESGTSKQQPNGTGATPMPGGTLPTPAIPSLPTAIAPSGPGFGPDPLGASPIPASAAPPTLPPLPSPGGIGTSGSPGTSGSAPPAASSMPPGSAAPPGLTGPPPTYPSTSPAGSTGPGPSPSSSPVDRFQQQMEQSRQQQLDSIQQMQDRMKEQHESLFNRHGSTGECLSCKHSLNETEMRRSSCPYCGVTWDYEIDQFGNKRELSNASVRNPFGGGNNAASDSGVDVKTARMVGLALGIFIGLAVVVGVIIGVIYIITSIASASAASQQHHYR